MSIIGNYRFNEFTSPFDQRDLVVEGILNPEFEIPKTLDLRNDLPPAWDQGREGACSAFAAAGMKQWQEKKDYGLDLELSKYFVYNLRSNYPSPGMYPRNTMNILRLHGIALKESFNKEWVGLGKIPKDVLKEALNHKITGYARVSTIDGLKKTLLKNGPCYGSFPVYDSGTRFWKPSFGKTKIVGGHAVAIVGYDEKGFIIRNSWGRRWGDNGHTNYPFSDWGSHMEIWTTIDDKSSEAVIKERTKVGKTLFSIRVGFLKWFSGFIQLFTGLFTSKK